METMEQRLISNWSKVNFSVPPSFVQPPECRPGKVTNPSSKTIPLIDLGGHDHAHTIMQILKASEEYGFFQVSVSKFSLISYRIFLFYLIYMIHLES
jgi:hypothetical protein